MTEQKIERLPISRLPANAGRNEILGLFDENGYVVLNGVLNTQLDLGPALEEFEDVLDRLAREWHGEGALSSPFDELDFGQRLIAVVRETGVRYSDHLNIKISPGIDSEDAPIHTGPAVFNLLVNSKLLDAVEHFIGPEIYSNPVQNVRFKVPERYLRKEDLLDPDTNETVVAATYWHQDQSAVSTEADNTRMLTVWIAVTDATRENGCMKLVPSSHKNGVALHCSGSRPGIPEALLGELRHHPEMKAGDVLFMHRCMMHGSLPNLSDGIRISFDLRYQPIGQPTGRDWVPGFVARSRAHPETELRDPTEWTRLWHEARARLASGTVDLSPWEKRFGPDHPWCA